MLATWSRVGGLAALDCMGVTKRQSRVAQSDTEAAAGVQTRGEGAEDSILPEGSPRLSVLHRAYA